MATKADLKELETHMATKADLVTTKDTVIEGIMAKYVPRFVDLSEIERRLERLEKQLGIRE